MQDENQKQQVVAFVRTSQIILAALVMGVVMFGVVIVFGMSGGQPKEGSILTLLAVIVGGANLMLCFVIPQFVIAANRRKIASGTWMSPRNQAPVPDSDAGKLAATYQVKMIIGAALLEGGCFLALVAYMTERQSLSLAVAAVLLLCLLAHFPTLGRVEAWIEEQLRRVEDERRFSP